MTEGCAGRGPDRVSLRISSAAMCLALSFLTSREVQCVVTRVCQHWCSLAERPQSHSCLPLRLPLNTEVTPRMRRLYSLAAEASPEGALAVGRNCMGLVPLTVRRLRGELSVLDPHLGRLRSLSRLEHFEADLCAPNLPLLEGELWRIYRDLAWQKPHLREARVLLFPGPSGRYGASYAPLLEMGARGVRLHVHLRAHSTLEEACYSGAEIFRFARSVTTEEGEADCRVHCLLEVLLSAQRPSGPVSGGGPLRAASHTALEEVTVDGYDFFQALLHLGRHLTESSEWSADWSICFPALTTIRVLEPAPYYGRHTLPIPAPTPQEAARRRQTMPMVRWRSGLTILLVQSKHPGLFYRDTQLGSAQICTCIRRLVQMRVLSDGIRVLSAAPGQPAQLLPI